MGFGVQGLGFGVWGLGFRVWGLGFRGLGVSIELVAGLSRCKWSDIQHADGSGLRVGTGPCTARG